MIKLGVLFGGRPESMRFHSCPLVPLINAIDKSKYEVVQIGINPRRGLVPL